MTYLVAQTVKCLSTMWETWVQSLGQEVPWRRKWQPTPVLLPRKSHRWRSLVGCIPWGRYEGVAMSRSRLSDFTFTFHFHAMEKEMATHSSVLAWRIPGMAEPGGLLSMGSHRVGHDWSDLAAAAAADMSTSFPCGSAGLNDNFLFKRFK